MEKKKEKMTLEKLAEMTQRGFKALENGLRKEMNEKFNLVNEKFDRVDEKFDRVDEKFNLVLNSQDQVLKRLEDLETDNTMGAGTSRQQEDKLENHEERIIVVEEELEINSAV